MDIQVGDRVRASDRIHRLSRVPRGLTGTVVAREVSCGAWVVSVCWDENIGGHDCRGKCPWGYGWNLREDSVELVDSECSIVDISDKDFAAIIGI